MWWTKGLRDLNETRDKVGMAVGVLQEDGERVFESLRITIRFIEDLEQADALRSDPLAAYDAWRELSAALQSIRVAVLAADEEGRVSDRVAQQLSMAREQVEGATFRFLTAYRQDVANAYRSEPAGDAALREIDRAIEQVAAKRLVTEARGARDEVRRVLDDTQRAAGVVSETVLAGHFAEYARRERGVADVLRAACALALLGITAIAAVLLFGGTADDLTASEELARLAVGVPVAALAAYLGRESARHRSASRWAHELELQLRTIDAYCEPLTDEARLQLRADFGRRVFLTNGVAPDGFQETGPSTAGDVTGLLQQALTLLRAPAHA